MKKASRPFRVLIVDDCPDDISQPYLLTSQLGCEVTLALDGRQAQGLNVVLYSGNRLSEEDLSSIEDYRILDFWEKPMGPVEILKRMKMIRERLGR